MLIIESPAIQLGHSRDIHLAEFGVDFDCLTGLVSEVYDEHIKFNQWDSKTAKILITQCSFH
ncbi:MAG: hypothetical protein CXT68_07225 [Methanobacteriota archaeon]|nr:MAG: hypothetical protein CXT68_07225 [Euryarchaeota archaeon]